MPSVTVEFYGETPDQSPVVAWLADLRHGSAVDRDRYRVCRTLLARLGAEGSSLRRPTSAPLGDGLFELRGVDLNGTPVRLLYAFAGRARAILLAGTVKRSSGEFERAQRLARRRLRSYLADPKAHTYSVSGGP